MPINRRNTKHTRKIFLRRTQTPVSYVATRFAILVSCFYSRAMKQIDLIDWDSIRFFRKSEFVCPCCDRVELDATFVLKLDLAREIAGVPFTITSGYRCPAHNVKVGGVKQSAHMSGLAADISCPDSVTRLNILRGLIVAGFRRVGMGKDFIHCDVDASKPNNVWLYEDR